MPAQKQLKAGLEGLVKDNANGRSLVENHPGAPELGAVRMTGKPDSESKAGDFGACCKFNTSN